MSTSVKRINRQVKMFDNSSTQRRRKAEKQAEQEKKKQQTEKCVRYRKCVNVSASKKPRKIETYVYFLYDTTGQHVATTEGTSLSCVVLLLRKFNWSGIQTAALPKDSTIKVPDKTRIGRVYGRNKNLSAVWQYTHLTYLRVNPKDFNDLSIFEEDNPEFAEQ